MIRLCTLMVLVAGWHEGSWWCSREMVLLSPHEGWVWQSFGRSIACFGMKRTGAAALKRWHPFRHSDPISPEAANHRLMVVRQICPMG
jgi:hypothetical protein